MSPAPSRTTIALALLAFTAAVPAFVAWCLALIADSSIPLV